MCVCARARASVYVRPLFCAVRVCACLRAPQLRIVALPAQIALVENAPTYWGLNSTNMWRSATTHLHPIPRDTHTPTSHTHTQAMKQRGGCHPLWRPLALAPGSQIPRVYSHVLFGTYAYFPLPPSLSLLCVRLSFTYSHRPPASPPMTCLVRIALFPLSVRLSAPSLPLPPFLPASQDSSVRDGFAVISVSAG